MNREKIADEIRAEIATLQQALHLLLGTKENLERAYTENPPAEAITSNGDAAPTKRQFSEARREQMRKIMKKRWAAAKRAGLNTPASVPVSGRARK